MKDDLEELTEKMRKKAAIAAAIGRANGMTIDQHIARVQIVGQHMCWTLPLKPASTGYHVISIRNRNNLAHRAFYEHLVERIPEGHQLDHLCRNRWCCHPNHVAPVTLKENLLRGDGVAGRNTRKQRCPKGHALSGSNLFVRKDKIGRGCKKCRKASHKAWRARQQ